MSDENTQAVIDAARQGATFQVIDKGHRHQVVYVPNGTNGRGEVHKLDLETYLPAPVRKRGTVSVLDAASFNQILLANSVAGQTTIYIDRLKETPAIIAVLNGHGDTGPGWGDHRADIEFRPTPQWTKWRGIDGKMLPQADFAEFVEDNIADIAEPVGAEMLEIAQYLTATRSVNFKSVVRVQNGQIQFRNEESIDAKVGAGQTIIPETFVLSLSPVLGVAPFRIPTRFRYRIQEGRLMLGVKLQRIEDLMRQIVEEVVAQIEPPDGVVMVEGVAPK